MESLPQRDAHTTASFRLGEWCVDPDLGRLTHDDGTTRQPEPKTLGLLLALAERPGRPFSREALRQRLWNGDHIAPGALKHLVWQLRRDLGDDAKAPRYVETVRGRGYRLVPEVVPVPEPASHAPEEPRARSLRPGLWIVGGAVGLLAVSIAALLANRPPSPPERPEPVARPLTSLAGNELSPSIAPDGSFVVFAWNGGEEGADYDLYRIATSGGAPEALVVGSRDEIEPAISPDGRQLAFLRGDVNRGGTELFLLDLVDGTERRVAGTAGLYLDVVWHGAGHGAGHGVGERLVVVERPAEDAPSRLIEVEIDSASRSAVRGLTEPSGQLPGDLYPALSPDGRSLAFYRGRRGRSGEILLLDLESGRTRSLAVPVGRVAGLAFDGTGGGLIVSSDRVPPRGLWRLSVTDGSARWLGFPGSFVTDPSPTRSGVLAYQDQRCDSNIWAISTAATAEPQAAVPALVSTRQDMQATFSPSGDRIAFLSNRGGESQIWIAEWPGGSPRPLPTEGGPVHSVDWSPSGNRLAFTIRNASGVSVVHTVELDAEYRAGRQEGFSDPSIHSLAPRWSQDGEALYYSASIDGEWRIQRHPLGGTPIDLGPGVAAQEEPGSAAIWILGTDGAGLTRTVDGSETGPTLSSISTADFLSWQAIEGGVFFIDRGDDGARRLIRWTTASGEVEPLATLDRNLPYPPGLSVSPDGLTVLWTRIDAVASDLMIVPSADGL